MPSWRSPVGCTTFGLRSASGDEKPHENLNSDKVYLNVGHTAITNDGLRELLPVKSLRSVWVIGTQVTASGLRQFEKSHGQCHGMIDR